MRGVRVCVGRRPLVAGEGRGAPIKALDPNNSPPQGGWIQLVALGPALLRVGLNTLRRTMILHGTGASGWTFPPTHG